MCSFTLLLIAQLTERVSIGTITKALHYHFALLEFESYLLACIRDLRKVT